MTRFDDLDRALVSYLDAEGTAATLPAGLLVETLRTTSARRPRRRLMTKLRHAASMPAIWPDSAQRRILVLAIALVALLLAALSIGLGGGSPQRSIFRDAVLPPVVAEPSTTAAADASRVPIAPAEAWIAYMAGIAGADSDRIWLVRPDGSDRHQVVIETGREGQQEHPDWSPDGSLIAFDQWYRDPASPGIDRTELWVAGPDGSNPRLVASCSSPCVQLSYPAFSPDRRSVAVVRFDKAAGEDWGSSAIEVVDLETGDRRVVHESADGSVAYYTPRWSPDGASIVFGLETYTDATEASLVAAEIAIVGADGLDERPRIVTPAGMGAWEPDWHPSGDRIVFRSRFDPADPADRTEPTDLWTISPDGTGLTNLSNLGLGAARAIQPTWTPDGTRLVFTLVDGFGSGQIPLIALMDADGGNVTRLGFGDGTAGRLRPPP